MTTYLGKSCSFCLPRVPFVNCRQFMYLVISLLVLRAGYGIWLYQFLIIAYLFTLLGSETLAGGYLFPCSSEINGLFPCLTKIKVLFPMFPTAWNLICFPVPLHFGHLFPCSPEVNVDRLFPHTLGGSKRTVLLVYVPVNSKTTMHHTRI